MTQDFTSSRPRLAAQDPTAEMSPCTVLLDDQTAAPGQRRSRLYAGLSESLAIDGPQALDAALLKMQSALECGLHAVMLLDYELGEALHGLPQRGRPASQILLFEGVTLLDGDEVEAWLAAQERAQALQGAPSEAGPSQEAVVTGLRAGVDEAGFGQAVRRIQAHIATGDTYQVNLSFRLGLTLHGSPLALYRQMRAHQAVPYGALLGLPDGRWVLSRSPELFVSHHGGWLEARPMKGTAAAGGSLDLAGDTKNRAENVMIVDLLRNDLGRVATPGTVAVPERFEVHRYGDVLQMTSTVRAQPRPDVGWPELLRAVFPCGSVTGAPKRRTLEIIRELEPEPRGLYTGAIGWLAPAAPGRLGDFCLSVPIRTLLLEPPVDGRRSGVLGVGAGITWDSRADDEWAECALKARFLTRLAAPLELFETLRASASAGAAHADRHLRRLARSAQALGFAFDAGRVRAALEAACAQLPAGPWHRLKLSLRPDGEVTFQSGLLSPLQGPVRVLLAPEATDSRDLFLQHKTTRRERYDAAWRAAEARGAFDMLFFNEAGELTEGGRSNVFVKIDGHWYTPPLACGVLAGVMRSVLLEDPQLAARERRIQRDDLASAQALMLCNALRGALPAELVSN